MLRIVEAKKEDRDIMMNLLKKTYMSFLNGRKQMLMIMVYMGMNIWIATLRKIIDIHI